MEAPETLRADDEFVVSRGQRVGEPASVLTVSTTANDPSAATLAQLENAYSLRTELDGSWAARPVGLMRERERMTLVLEDPGGLLLDGLARRPLGIEEFLRLAVKGAAASTSGDAAKIWTNIQALMRGNRIICTPRE